MNVYSIAEEGMKMNKMPGIVAEERKRCAMRNPREHRMGQYIKLCEVLMGRSYFQKLYSIPFPLRLTPVFDGTRQTAGWNEYA